MSFSRTVYMVQEQMREMSCFGLCLPWLPAVLILPCSPSIDYMEENKDRVDLGKSCISASLVVCYQPPTDVLVTQSTGTGCGTAVG